ncbi:alpha/beta hydrolase-fold protein [Hymenobacter saemangeumensis]|uniref:Alpha/beta hydrolase-fold protein n=1 Tax=Hymenobacter saemangeumensis TaxID=1084522 RepID=A0ABP8IBF4_9BACT
MRRLLLLALLAAAPASAQTVLSVTRVPANTPAGDTLYVAGSFNGWNPRSDGFALRKQADGSYQVSLPAGTGAAEYKFTRGTWATAEATAQGQPLANRKAAAGAPALIRHEIAAWEDLSGSAAQAKRHTASANVRVLAEAFNMPQLNRKRRVWIYLPAGYHQNKARRYPVLYLHDGQNVFDEASSFSGEWGVDEILDRLQARGKAAGGCIVVAVDNGGEFRLDEYIPWRSAALKDQTHQGGQGDAYVDFLTLTLKPYVDARYRTRPEAASTGIAGSSLGGLISFYAALKYPRVYGRVGVFSPAFWVCQDSLQAYARRHRAAVGARFYFLCGPKESETMLPLTVYWRNALRSAGVPAAHVRLVAPADGEHREWFWQREFPAAYHWLFNPAPGNAGSPRPRQ